MVARAIGTAVFAALASLTATAAGAAPATTRHEFSIRAEAYSEALIDFAVQADISLLGASRCVGRSAGLRGRFTVEEALTRLLADAPCRFEVVDSHTVRLLAGRLTPAPPRPVSLPPKPAAPSEVPMVSEVIVTATKRAVADGRLAASVSTVNGMRLAETGATDVFGAVDQVAGLTMTNLGPGRDKLMLRGLSDGTFTGRTQSTVGTYLDDVPITYNAPDPDLRLADVDAIEVLRGPQGALYGGGSLSGVFRIITRKPDPDHYGAEVIGLAAWTEGGAPSREIEGMVNLPIALGQSALRLVAYRDEAGGYLDDVNLRQSNVDRTLRQGPRIATRTRLGPNWTVTLGVTSQHLDSNDTQYTMPSLGHLKRANRVRETHKNEFSQAVMMVSGSGAWGRFDSSTAYVRHAFSSQYDASAALGLFGAVATDLGVYFESAHTNMLVEDAVWSSPTAGRLQWLLGVYGSSTVERDPSSLTQRGAVGPPQTLYDEQRRDHLREGAVYGEATYALGGGWTATVGARIFQTRLNTHSAVRAPPPGVSRRFTRVATFGDWSPKASLQYQFEGGPLVYVLASEGHRAGGFNSGGLSAPGPSRRAFIPDRLENYELGAKLKLFDRKVDLRTAVFYDLWSNIQTDQYLASGLSYTANVGDGANLGWESEATWRPTPRVSLQLNALFDSPKLTRVNPGFEAKTRAGLPGVPDASLGALAIYEHPLKGGMALLFTTEAGYVGKSHLTFDPAIAPEMGGYVTGKLSVQLKARQWRLAAYLTNPANATGDTFAYGNPFSFGQVRQVTPQRPRTLSLALTATF